MTDTAQKFDLDTLTDDEVMKLDPSQVQALMNGEGVSNEQPANDADANQGDGDPALAQGNGGDQDPAIEGNPQGSGEPFNGTGGNETDQGIPETKANPEPAKPDAQKAEADPKNGEKPDANPDVKSKEADPATQALAMEFYTKISAPFKADGKEIQVRSPEDVIRLMQMGVNYSRRMQEMKPLKAMDNMLKAHGLNDPQKLSFLIDVSKGKPEAIQKLLKDQKIDPIDLDVTKDTGYKPTNYEVDPKDLAFQEAIENTLSADGGKDLIKDINASWDDVSKEALRDQPSIFENLLEQKRSGVYGKVKSELEYQRTMGFLTNVPFLQAYHQVSDAMQKAGVFGRPKEVQSTGVETPIDTGIRKAAPKPKTEQPNPNLSSINQPRVAPGNPGNQAEPDYSTMSDADFLKLAPPR